jgi:hypothetical protein
VQVVGINIADGFVKKRCQNVFCLPAEVLAGPSLNQNKLKYAQASRKRCYCFLFFFLRGLENIYIPELFWWDLRSSACESIYSVNISEERKIKGFDGLRDMSIFIQNCTSGL